MGKAIYSFWWSEEGQDMVEYTFLIALVALGAIGLLQTQGTAVSAIWVSADSTAHSAVAAVS